MPQDIPDGKKIPTKNLRNPQTSKIHLKVAHNQRQNTLDSLAQKPWAYIFQVVLNAVLS